MLFFQGLRTTFMTEQINEQLQTTTIVWQLDDLYSSPEDNQLSQDLASCLQQAQQLHNKYSTRLATLSARQLLSLVQDLEELASLSGKIATYAYLHFATQVQAPQAGALLQKVQEELSQVSKELLFFEHELCHLPAEQADTLLGSEELRSYSHYLKNIRRYARHLLSQVEETLLLEKSPVSTSCWVNLFDKVLAHQRYGREQRGEEEVLAELYNSDRAIRRQAASDLTSGLQQQLHIQTHIFNTILADKMIGDRLRGYQRWDESMHLANELETSTVDTLVTEVEKRYDIVQRYYQLKAEILGHSTLYDYDRYAPVPFLPEQQIGWPQCQQMVTQAFAQFSPRLAEIVSLFFSKGWIHAPLLPGKQGGAFAHPCVPQVHPYVLVNYNGTLNDTSTVAHELGHGVHQYLAGQQGTFNADTPLVLAETASVFAELLLFHSQLELLTDPRQRRAFICQKLESIFATVFRQVAMNRFEELIHNHRRQQGELSSDDFNRYWRQSQQQMFAESVTLREEYDCWWSYISHFVSSPGYVYSYAFGELLVLALYNLYQQRGATFVSSYEQLLAAGGSLSPAQLLAPFDIHLDDPAFWQGGLETIDALLQEIE